MYYSNPTIIKQQVHQISKPQLIQFAKQIKQELSTLPVCLKNQNKRNMLINLYQFARSHYYL